MEIAEGNAANESNPDSAWIHDATRRSWSRTLILREKIGEDFHPQMDRETFAQHIRLDAVQFYGTDHATLLYDDGHPFLGHSIVADLMPDGSIGYVTLFG